MRRTLMLGLLLGLIFCSLSLAHAQEVCWRLQDGAGNPLLDVVRMAYEQPPGTNIFKLHGPVDAGPLYQQVGSGTAVPKSDDGSMFRVGLTLVHDTTFFGSNWTCALTLFVVADDDADDFLDGTWKEQCAGGPSVHTPVSGLVVSFNCPVLLSATEPQAFGIMQSRKPSLTQEDVLAQQMNTFGEYRAAGKGNFEFLPQQ